MQAFQAPVRLGVIGTGWVASMHAEALAGNPRARIVAVAEPVADRARQYAEKVGAARIYATAAELLADPNVDAVTICTPPKAHMDLILAALAAGKPSICEKPVVLGLADLEACLAAERAAAGLVGCVFQWRFGRGLRMLQHLMAQGLTGKLLWCSAQVNWYRGPEYFQVAWRGRWEDVGGGVAVSQAIHALDALLLIGGPVATVHAQVHHLNHPVQVEDYAHALVNFTSGAQGVVQCTLDSHEEISRLTFGFEHVTAISCGLPYAASDWPWTFKARSGATSAAGPGLQSVIEERARRYESLPPAFGHKPQLEDFIDALVEGRRPQVGLADCLPTAQFLSGLYKSAAANGAAVQLPIQPGDPHWARWYGPVPS